MNKVKVSELQDFDVTDCIKTVNDLKDWMRISIDEDEGIPDIEYTLNLLNKAIARMKNDTTRN